MRCRIGICIFLIVAVLFLFADTCVASEDLNVISGFTENAQQAQNSGINAYPIDDSNASAIVTFWDLPRWIQITFLTLTLLESIGLFFTLPILIGRLKKIMDNENRQLILNYIQEYPGCTIADISENRNINRGTLKYHITLLQMNDKIFARHDGKFVRLYRKISDYRNMENMVTPYLRNDMSRAILHKILENPGITNQDLSSLFNLDKSTIHWYLQKFNHDGIISFVHQGRYNKCFLSDEAKIVMQRVLSA